MEVLSNDEAGPVRYEMNSGYGPFIWLPHIEEAACEVS